MVVDGGSLPLLFDVEFEEVGRGAVEDVAERREQVGVDPLRGLVTIRCTMTDPVLRLTLSEQLTALGNGVVPQQGQRALEGLNMSFGLTAM